MKTTTLRLSKAALGLLLALNPTVGVAQTGPPPAPVLSPPSAATERGFKPEQAYDFGDLDSVNLFNGNLNLTIPIGGTYPVGPNLSYGLTLVYNSNLWEFEYVDPETGMTSLNCDEPWIAMGYDDPCRTRSGPNVRSNASTGWTLSFGELLGPLFPLPGPNPVPQNPWNPTGRPTYTSPDGGGHSFWPTLHKDEPNPGDGWFTRDGTYLRLHQVGAQWAIDFPSGIRHLFDSVDDGTGRWRLQRMEDPFGNYMEVALGVSPEGLPQWEISDSHGRSHRIVFEAADYSLSGQRVKKVDLEVLGQDRAVYDFGYHPSHDYLPACHDTSIGLSQDPYPLELLASVRHEAASPLSAATDTWEYRFDYFEEELPAPVGTVHCSAKAARLKKMVVPTQGSYEWDYRTYGSPAVDCSRLVPNHTPGPYGIFPELPLFSNANLSVTWGVAQKLKRDIGGTILERVDYKSGGLISSPSPEECNKPTVWAGKVNIVFREIGNSRVSREENYFSLWASGEDPENLGWHNDEYGLPIVHGEDFEDSGGKKYALSRKTYRCDLANRDDPINMSSCDLYRSHFLRYERSFGGCDPGGLDQPVLCSELNQRVAGEAVTYEKDREGTPNGPPRWTATDFTEFDGFGHYRVSKALGNFPGLPGSINPPFPEENGNFQRVITDYNSGGGTYSFDPDSNTGNSSLEFPDFDAPWLLNTYDSRTVEETDKGVAVEKFCFDKDSGFLEGRRVLKGDIQSNQDSVVLLLPDARGFAKRELYYGGDLAANAPDVCGGPQPGAEYRIDHTYAFGVPESSWFVEPGALGQLQCTDSSTRDCILRRRSEVIDPSTGLATASSDPSGVTTHYAYDTLSRLVESAPDGRASTRMTYDTQGPWQVSLGQWDGTGLLKDERYGYDGIGRLRKVSRSMPNGGRAVRRIQYHGNSTKKQETEFQPASSAAQWTKYDNYDPFGRVGRIQPPDGADFVTTIDYYGVGGETSRWKFRNANGNPQDAYRFKRFNRLGRLIKLHEPNPDGSGELRTWYGYDIGGRLNRVHSGAQIRRFEYDRRGFLLSETHPEFNPSGSSSLSYGDYDSLGNAGYRNLAMGFDLEFRYDRAGRLTQVLEPGNAIPWKELFYGRTNSAGPPVDHRVGKVVQAKRRNAVLSLNGETGATSDIVITESFAYREPGGAMTEMELRSSDGQVFHETLTYDSLGNVDTLDYPDCLYPGACAAAVPARQLDHDYREGYLTSITGYLNDILYHPNAMWQQINHSNGVLDHQALYKPNGTDHYLQLPGGLSTSGVQNGLDLDLPDFRYDGARNITQIGTDEFGYDSLSRLARANLGTDGVRDYTYDRYGNLVAMANQVSRSMAVSEVTNRLTGSNFDYDPAGNLTEGFGAIRAFDPFNMVATEMNGDINRQMLYTADNERVAVIDEMKEEQRWTLRGPGKRVLRTVSWNLDSGAFTWKRDNIFRGSALLATTVNNDTGGEETFHFHLDHLGTSRLKTDATGARVASYKYWPYGERTASTPTDDDDTLRFTGHERDFGCAEGACAETGAQDDLDYMHARYYSPWVGRFLSVDPIRYRDGSREAWSLYAYVANNPVNNTDPTGQISRRQGASILLSLVPVVGDIKDIQEVLTGRDLVSGENLSPGERAVTAVAAALPIVGGAALRKVGSSIVKHGDEVADTGRKLLPEKAGPVGHISPSEVAGKTPSQIDKRARELGLEARGPDPAGGRGAYVDPQTGKQRILSHPNADPPHGHVNNPAGERLGSSGEVVSRESPEAHLPIEKE
ncbi:MAG: hypothetical protein K0U98_08775 [Deltaproteobacteria bacterium]|nr:hypothetical protein [Deltaproteobacteria bacterium]